MIYITQIQKPSFIFANDTALFYANKNIDQLEINNNKLLENISNWLKAKNKLTLNVDKSKLLFFDIATNTIKRSAINVYINGQKLEIIRQAKYLGVLLDRKLSWRQQIDSV